MVKGSGTIYTGIADHQAVFITSSLSTEHRPHANPLPRHVKFDYGRLEELQTNVSEKLRGYTDITDPEMAAEKLVTIIKEETDLLSSARKSRQFTPIQPWITAGILRSIRNKNKLLKKFHLNRTSENQLKFRKYRNMLRLTIRHAKKIYFQDQFRKHAHNPRLLWANLHESIRRTKIRTGLPSQFEVNGMLTDNCLQIADTFNSYYCNVGPEFDFALGPSNTDPMSYMKDVQAPKMMSFHPITAWDISKTISNLKEVGAGLDGVSIKLIKSLVPSILTELTHLINLCIVKSILSRIFKLALITPIYKAGSRTHFSNYRPISILPALSKILESIMYGQPITFIKDNDILYDFQFGFRQQHSTYMPISLLHDFIATSMADKCKTAAIYLDLARAFDTVNVNILLSKLPKYGISGNAHNFLKSYLTSRAQNSNTMT